MLRWALSKGMEPTACGAHDYNARLRHVGNSYFSRNEAPWEALGEHAGLAGGQHISLRQDVQIFP